MKQQKEEKILKHLPMKYGTAKLRSMRCRMMGVMLALVAGFAGSACGRPIESKAAEWGKSENGKYWMYFWGPDDPVTDDWIEVDGKTYYLDTKGYMKTGWVTDKNSKKKYYMGEDGAMCVNMFTPDGSYVGPEGTQVTEYDTYRKAIRSEMKKSNSKKSKGTKKDQAVQGQPCFLLTDLNKDGYRDLVVTDAMENGGSILKIAVWDPEELNLQLSAEFDVPGNGDRNTLYLDPEGEGVWLEIVRSGSDISLFQMEYDSSMLESKWEFKMEQDDWGGPLYYVNDLEENQYYWDKLMGEAMAARGNVPLTGFIPATEENIKSQLDLVLSQEELWMWGE